MADTDEQPATCAYPPCELERQGDEAPFCDAHEAWGEFLGWWFGQLRVGPYSVTTLLQMTAASLAAQSAKREPATLYRADGGRLK